MTKIKELEKGKTTLKLMIKNVEEKLCSNGSYLQITLTDGVDEIISKKWKSEIKDFTAKSGDILEVELTIGEYQGKPDYIFGNYRVCNDLDVNKYDFIKKAPIDLEKSFGQLFNVAGSFSNEDLKKIVQTILAETKDKYIKWSAAKTVHHNLIGGLLYHSYRMTEGANYMSKIYTSANRDLLMAGCILHDIGKLIELETDEFGTSDYTIDGNLFGHLYLGGRIIEKVGEKLNISSEIIRSLTHIIISHHGIIEFGAIKAPHTIEAMLVHELDMIDSYAYSYENVLTTLEPGEMSSQSNYFLNNVKVYKNNF